MGRKIAWCVIVAGMLAAVGLSGIAGQRVSAGDRGYYDLSKREHVIHNLVMCTEGKDIEYYRSLLHEDFESRHGLYRIDRDKEIASTEAVFAAASRITMTVSEGEWIALTELNGTSCPDCWETTRDYSINVVVPESKQGSYSTDGRLYIVIVPVSERDEQRYNIRILDYVKP